MRRHAYTEIKVQIFFSLIQSTRSESIRGGEGGEQGTVINIHFLNTNARRGGRR